MRDLFEHTEKVESNGKSNIKKTAFKAQVATQIRDEEFSDLIKETGLPSSSEMVAFKSNGVSDVGSIFSYMLQQGKMKTLYLSTWIISRPNIDRICEAIDNGLLDSVYFAASTRLKQLKKSDYAYLAEQFKKRNNCHFKVLNNHAKTFSVADENGNYYTVTGSGNWTQNPRIEMYVIHNNKDLHDFNKQWITELL